MKFEREKLSVEVYVKMYSFQFPSQILIRQKIITSGNKIRLNLDKFIEMFLSLFSFRLYMSSWCPFHL